ncbi:MAG: VWA domain-containing protein [Ignavibacteria bacterium]|nr:VWA domain-containing protein [Ignavibacteria bacterium]
MKNLSNAFSVFTALCILCVCSLSVKAGGLMESRNKTGTNVIASTVTNVNVTVREQVAITTTTQTFIGEPSKSKIAYGFSLPPSATVTNFKWFRQGTWFVASLSKQDTAAVNGGGGSSFSTFAKSFGENPFVFPFADSLLADSTLIVELTYIELLQYGGGLVRNVYNATSVVSAANVLINNLTIDIRSEHELSDFVWELPLPIQQLTQNSIKIRVSDVIVKGTLEFSFRILYDNLTMNVMSTKPPTEAGYAVMLAVPKSKTESGDILKKRFTIIIDQSGSMVGVKYAQAKEAAKYCLTRLQMSDQLNVILFDDRVTNWQSSHLPATPSNISSAVNFVEASSTRGGTNIMSALTAGLKQMVADEYVNIILFLTDGMGVVDTISLKKSNTTNTRIFVFGIGSDVSELALASIAKSNRGELEVIKDAGSTSARISALFDKIKDPLIKDPSINFAPNLVYDIFPRIMPDLYAGEQLRMVGRYSVAGDCKVTVVGSNASGQTAQSFAATLSSDSTINLFVPKIWAKYRIEELVTLMKGVQTQTSLWKEWRDEIIRLGVKFGLVTPYTTFSDKGEVDNTGGGTGGTGSGSGTGGTGSGSGSTGSGSTGGGTGGTGGGTGGTGGGATGVEDLTEKIASFIMLAPNPTRAATTIKIDLTRVGLHDIRVELVDMQGNVVRLLFYGNANADELQLEWDGTNELGAQVASGQYLVRCVAGTHQSVTVLTVLR